MADIRIGIPGGGPIVDIRQQLEAEHRRLPDREAQRGLRESLRYKHCYSALSLSRRTMQRIGDWGRRWIWSGGRIFKY